MTDWFALLDRGHIVTGTGNSDTHHLTYNLGGYPRNYVLVDKDDPAVVTPGDVAKAVKAHHAFFTTGPIVDFKVGTTGIGDLAPAPGGKATADITVRAAPWISVSRVVVVRRGPRGHPLRRRPGRAHGRALPAARTILAVPNDTYVVVRVEGDGSLAPVVGGKDRQRAPVRAHQPDLPRRERQREVRPGAAARHAHRARGVDAQ